MATLELPVDFYDLSNTAIVGAQNITQAIADDDVLRVDLGSAHAIASPILLYTTSGNPYVVDTDDTFYLMNAAYDEVIMTGQVGITYTTPEIDGQVFQLTITRNLTEFNDVNIRYTGNTVTTIDAGTIGTSALRMSGASIYLDGTNLMVDSKQLAYLSEISGVQSNLNAEAAAIRSEIATDIATANLLVSGNTLVQGALVVEGNALIEQSQRIDGALSVGADLIVTGASVEARSAHVEIASLSTSAAIAAAGDVRAAANVVPTGVASTLGRSDALWKEAHAANVFVGDHLSAGADVSVGGSLRVEGVLGVGAIANVEHELLNLDYLSVTGGIVTGHTTFEANLRVNDALVVASAVLPMADLSASVGSVGKRFDEVHAANIETVNVHAVGTIKVGGDPVVLESSIQSLREAVFVDTGGNVTMGNVAVGGELVAVAVATSGSVSVGGAAHVDGTLTASRIAIGSIANLEAHVQNLDYLELAGGTVTGPTTFESTLVAGAALSVGGTAHLAGARVQVDDGNALVLEGNSAPGLFAPTVVVKSVDYHAGMHVDAAAGKDAYVALRENGAPKWGIAARAGAEGALEVLDSSDFAVTRWEADGTLDHAYDIVLGGNFSIAGDALAYPHYGTEAAQNRVGLRLQGNLYVDNAPRYIGEAPDAGNTKREYISFERDLVSLNTRDVPRLEVVHNAGDPYVHARHRLIIDGDISVAGNIVTSGAGGSFATTGYVDQIKLDILGDPNLDLQLNTLAEIANAITSDANFGIKVYERMDEANARLNSIIAGTQALQALSVAGSAHAHSLDVADLADVQRLSVNTSLSVGGAARVIGQALLSDDVSVGGDLVLGAGSLSVASSAKVQSLSVTGALHAASLIVAGNAHAGYCNVQHGVLPVADLGASIGSSTKRLAEVHAANLEVGNVNAHGSIAVGNDRVVLESSIVALRSAVHVDTEGHVTVTDALVVAGNAMMSGNLSVAGDATVDGVLTVATIALGGGIANLEAHTHTVKSRVDSIETIVPGLTPRGMILYVTSLAGYLGEVITGEPFETVYNDKPALRKTVGIRVFSTFEISWDVQQPESWMFSAYYACNNKYSDTFTLISLGSVSINCVSAQVRLSNAGTHVTLASNVAALGHSADTNAANIGNWVKYEFIYTGGVMRLLVDGVELVNQAMGEVTLGNIIVGVMMSGAISRARLCSGADDEAVFLSSTDTAPEKHFLRSDVHTSIVRADRLVLPESSDVGVDIAESQRRLTDLEVVVPLNTPQNMILYVTSLVGYFGEVVTGEPFETVYNDKPALRKTVGTRIHSTFEISWDVQQPESWMFSAYYACNNRYKDNFVLISLGSVSVNKTFGQVRLSNAGTHVNLGADVTALGHSHASNAYDIGNWVKYEFIYTGGVLRLLVDGAEVVNQAMGEVTLGNITVGLVSSSALSRARLFIGADDEAAFLSSTDIAAEKHFVRNDIDSLRAMIDHASISSLELRGSITAYPGIADGQTLAWSETASAFVPAQNMLDIATDKTFGANLAVEGDLSMGGHITAYPGIADGQTLAWSETASAFVPAQNMLDIATDKTFGANVTVVGTAHLSEAFVGNVNAASVGMFALKRSIVADDRLISLYRGSAGDMSAYNNDLIVTSGDVSTGSDAEYAWLQINADAAYYETAAIEVVERGSPWTLTWWYYASSTAEFAQIASFGGMVMEYALTAEGNAFRHLGYLWPKPTDGAWTHVAWVVDYAAGSTKLFHDGVEIAPTQGTVGAALEEANPVLRIGGLNGARYADVRLYAGRALTGDELKTLMGERSVNIEASLVPSAASTVSLGSATKPFMGMHADAANVGLLATGSVANVEASIVALDTAMALIELPVATVQYGSRGETDALTAVKLGAFFYNHASVTLKARFATDADAGANETLVSMELISGLDGIVSARAMSADPVPFDVYYKSANAETYVLYLQPRFVDIAPLANYTINTTVLGAYTNDQNESNASVANATLVDVSGFVDETFVGAFEARQLAMGNVTLTKALGDRAVEFAAPKHPRDAAFAVHYRRTASAGVTTLVDKTGNGNDISVTNETFTTSVAFGEDYYWMPQDNLATMEVANVELDGALICGNKSHTFSFHFYPNNWSGNQSMLILGEQGGSARDSSGFYLDGSGQLYWYMGLASEGRLRFSAFALRQWVHIVAAYDAFKNTRTVWFDGVEQTPVFVEPTVTDFALRVPRLCIGRIISPTFSTYAYQFRFADFRLYWGYAMPGAEIALISTPKPRGYVGPVSGQLIDLGTGAQRWGNLYVQEANIAGGIAVGYLEAGNIEMGAMAAVSGDIATVRARYLEPYPDTVSMTGLFLRTRGLLDISGEGNDIEYVDGTFSTGIDEDTGFDYVHVYASTTTLRNLTLTVGEGVPQGYASQSWAVWLRIDSSASNREILHYGRNANSASWRLFVVDDALLKWDFVSLRTAYFPYTVGEWFHLALVHDRDHNELYAYVNGVPAVSSYSGANANNITNDRNDLYIGNGYYDTTNFRFSDLRGYWNRALTPPEVYAIAKRPIAPAEGLIEMGSARRPLTAVRSAAVETCVVQPPAPLRVAYDTASLVARYSFLEHGLSDIGPYSNNHLTSADASWRWSAGGLEFAGAAGALESNLTVAGGATVQGTLTEWYVAFDATIPAAAVSSGAALFRLGAAGTGTVRDMRLEGGNLVLAFSDPATSGSIGFAPPPTDQKVHIAVRYLATAEVSLFYNGVPQTVSIYSNLSDAPAALPDGMLRIGAYGAYSACSGLRLDNFHVFNADQATEVPPLQIPIVLAGNVHVEGEMRLSNIVQTPTPTDLETHMAHWRGATDLSGNNNTLEYYNNVADFADGFAMTTASSHAVHTSMVYNGSTNPINQGRSHSFAMWIYCPATAIDGSIAQFWRYGANDTSYRTPYLAVNAAGELEFSIFSNDTATYAMFSTDTWVHVAVALRDNQTPVVWYNAIEQTALTTTSFVFNGPDYNYFYFGARIYNTRAGIAFGDAHIYQNYIVTTVEVRAHMGARVHSGMIVDGTVRASAIYGEVIATHTLLPESNVAVFGTSVIPWHHAYTSTLHAVHEVRTANVVPGVGDGLPVDADLLIHWYDGTLNDYGGNNGIADVSRVSTDGGTYVMQSATSYMRDASMTTATNGAIVNTSRDFSIVFDLYVPSSAVDGAEMGICNYGLNANAKYLDVYLDAVGDLYLYGASNMYWSFTFGQLDRWVHVTISHACNSKRTRVWYDNAEQTLQSTNNAAFFTGPGNNYFYIGSYSKNTRPGVAFRNVRLYYDRAIEGAIAYGVRVPAIAVDSAVTAESVLVRGALVGASVHPGGGHPDDGNVNTGALGTVGSFERPWSEMHANTVHVYETLRVNAVETFKPIDETYEMFRYNGLKDESGNGNDLSFSNVLDTGRGLRMRTSQGVASHTTLDHVLYGPNFMATVAQADHIFSFWVYMPAEAIDGSPVALVRLAASTNNNQSSAVYIDASGNLAWSSGGSTVVNGSYRTYFTAVPTDTWTHVIVEVLTTSVIRAWYNGVEQSKTQEATGTGDWPGTEGVYIGRYIIDTRANVEFRDVRMFWKTSVPTSAEGLVYALYREGPVVKSPFVEGTLRSTGTLEANLIVPTTTSTSQLGTSADPWNVQAANVAVRDVLEVPRVQIAPSATDIHLPTSIVAWYKTDGTSYGLGTANNNDMDSAVNMDFTGESMRFLTATSYMFNTTLYFSGGLFVHNRTFSFSVALWVYLPATANDGTRTALWGMGLTGTVSYTHRYAYVDEGGYLVFSIMNRWHRYAKMPTGRWVHLAFAYDISGNDTVSTYVDGVLQTATLELNPTVNGSNLDGDNFTLGYISQPEVIYAKPGTEMRDVRFYYDYLLFADSDFDDFARDFMPHTVGMRLPSRVIAESDVHFESNTWLAGDVRRAAADVRIEGNVVLRSASGNADFSGEGNDFEEAAFVDFGTDGVIVFQADAATATANVRLGDANLVGQANIHAFAFFVTLPHDVVASDATIFEFGPNSVTSGAKVATSIVAATQGLRVTCGGYAEYAPLSAGKETHVAINVPLAGGDLEVFYNGALQAPTTTSGTVAFVGTETNSHVVLGGASTAKNLKVRDFALVWDQHFKASDLAGAIDNNTRVQFAGGTGIQVSGNAAIEGTLSLGEHGDVARVLDRVVQVPPTTLDETRLVAHIASMLYHAIPQVATHLSQQYAMAPYDVSVNMLDPTSTSTSTSVVGTVDYGFFDHGQYVEPTGTTSYYQLNGITSGAPAAISYAFWFYGIYVNGTAIFAHGNGTGTGTSNYVYYSAGIEMNTRSRTQTRWALPPDNAWTHMVFQMTSAGGEWELYYNGVKQTPTVTANTTSPLWNLQTFVQLGDTDFHTYSVGKRYANFQVFTQILSRGDILQIMGALAAAPMPAIANEPNVVISAPDGDSSVNARFNQVPRSVELLTETARAPTLEVPNPTPASGSFGAAFWFYQPAYPAGLNRSVMNWGGSVGLRHDAANVMVAYIEGGSSVEFARPAENAWTHIGFLQDMANIALYYDGVAQTPTFNGTGFVENTSSNTLVMGASRIAADIQLELPKDFPSIPTITDPTYGPTFELYAVQGTVLSSAIPTSFNSSKSFMITFRYKTTPTTADGGLLEIYDSANQNILTLDANDHVGNNQTRIRISHETIDINAYGNPDGMVHGPVNTKTDLAGTWQHFAIAVNVDPQTNASLVESWVNGEHNYWSNPITGSFGNVTLVPPFNIRLGQTYAQAWSNIPDPHIAQLRFYVADTYFTREDMLWDMQQEAPVLPGYLGMVGAQYGTVYASTELTEANIVAAAANFELQPATGFLADSKEIVLAAVDEEYLLPTPSPANAIADIAIAFVVRIPSAASRAAAPRLVAMGGLAVYATSTQLEVRLSSASGQAFYALPPLDAYVHVFVDVRTNGLASSLAVYYDGLLQTPASTPEAFYFAGFESTSAFMAGPGIAGLRLKDVRVYTDRDFAPAEIADMYAQATKVLRFMDEDVRMGNLVVDDVLTVHGVINSDRVVVDVATVKDLMITPVSEPPMPLVAYRGTQSDISGNNLTLTSVSAMTFAVSDDTFVYMEGTSRFAVATLTSGVNSSEVVTLCSWVYMPSYGGAILHNGVNSLSLEPDTLTLRCTDAGTLQLFRTDVEITTIETIPLNTWVHVAAVSNGNGDTVQFYIDGIPTESIANTAGITWSALGGSAFAIGRRNGFGAVTGQRWAGTRLYQDALTAEQVLQARAADHPGIAVGVIPATSDAEADLLGTSLNGVYLKAGALHVRLS